MKLSLLCTLLLALLLGAAPARAQIVIDTARGLVGQKVRVPLHLTADSVESGFLTLTATMQLSNPTVFYPERFTAPSGDSVIGSTMRQVKDSIYEVSFTIQRSGGARSGGDTLIYLDGEALAGSDSICIIDFTRISVDGNELHSASGIVITRSIGPPLPYVRFAILEQNYPNPVPRGGSTTWAYRIDKRSDVRFHFYNVLGEELMVVQLGDQDIGPHTYLFTPQLDMPTGAYLVRLVTNSGSADKLMMVLR